ncbi:ABC-type multidrug/protein/lipid transport system ATPase component [Mycoplasmopsis maculosa]|uniref:ABC-type multidrug/protein/lipid transport system ATPase component n=1 Tax=Mycoplasmopsis maculosa TaxID=114885 RepID=A0A449B3J0_9BACT|nr:ABC transporter ATP-binding protein [Mycoplasmopsis maculosa]VEU75163.1 ABC-type multidrug/protein/lipid transport system ATPase component [Mycoplasmopsis maculosa]
MAKFMFYNQSLNKKIDKKSAFKSFFKIIVKFSLNKYIWIIAIFLGVFVSLLSTGAAWLTGFIIDNFFKLEKFDLANFDFKNYALFISLLAISYILQKGLLIIQKYLLNRASILIGSRIRHIAYEKIQKMPISFFEDQKTGELMSSLTNDISSFVDSLINIIGTSITVVFSTIISICFMFYYLPIVALIAIFVIPINFLPIFFIVKSNMKQYVIKQQKLAEFNGYLEEILDAMPLINIHQKQETIIKEFDNFNNEMLKPNLEIGKKIVLIWPWFAFSKVLDLIEIIGFAILLKSVWSSMPGQLSAGVLISFSLYITMICDNFNMIFEVINSFQTGLGAAVRLEKILFIEPNIDESKLKNLDFKNGNISFKNVNFYYPSNPHKLILKDINFEIKKGETLALVGKTGSGKTTIAKLLAKFYYPTSGQILIDNQTIQEINEKSWRSNIDLILQDTFILRDTVLNNLKFVNPNLDEDEIIRISKLTSFDEVVKALPNGYNTLLSNNASNLSYGQRQLLSITRSLISNRPISILDEATSDIDSINEKIIQNTINELVNKKTMIIIAHRLSTIKNANKILVIDEGKIIEQGNHNELINKNGYYKKLYNSNFEY